MSIKNFTFRKLILLVPAALLLLSSCSQVQYGGPPTEFEYVGSAECATCHAQVYGEFIESGHAHILTKVEGSTQPSIPFTTADGITITPPQGYTWADISYLIGGSGWKAQFIDSDGFIMTENGDTQFNLEDLSQVAYNPNTPMGTEVYTCGACHTTGWMSTAEGASPKDGLTGMGGDFSEPGVTCEQCHGPGNKHLFSKKAKDITINRTVEACAECHSRNNGASVSAYNGFISNHGQYDEMMSGPHSALTNGCITCHDPHASSLHDDAAAGTGITTACTDCHTVSGNATHHGATCVTCHMADVTKSAINRGYYQGDLSTHIFNIDTRLNPTFFSQDGTQANVENEGVTVDFVCYQCHKDSNGNGGSAPQFSYTIISNYGTNFHNK